MHHENLKRVFIHEIGHFTARELNCQLYKIGEGVENILIQTHSQSNWIDYSGGATARKPKGHIDNGEVENVNQYIAVILYGCIFQTLYLKFESDYKFRECFNLSDSANGKCDAKEFANMGKYITGSKRKEIVEYTSNISLNKLFSDHAHLKKAFDLEPLNFLKTEEIGFSVNLELLKEELTDFIDEHKKYYSEYITNIERIKNER